MLPPTFTHVLSHHHHNTPSLQPTDAIYCQPVCVHSTHLHQTIFVLIKSLKQLITVTPFPCIHPLPNPPSRRLLLLLIPLCRRRYRR